MSLLTDTPPMRLDSMPSVADAAGTWWLIETYPQAEKPAANLLRAKGIGYFLPMAARVQFHRDRQRIVKRNVVKPLFPRYMFVCGDEGDRYEAACLPQVMKTQAVCDQARLRRELTSLERGLLQNPALDAFALRSGQKCVVRSGPWEGMGGIIEVTGRAFVLIHVSVLGQIVPLEIEPELLELLN